MELVKKNVLSILCGVVALAAIVFHFVVTTGQFATLETEAKARAEKPAAAKSLLAEARTFTQVSDAPGTKLRQFPNPKVIELNDLIAGRLHAEATKLVTKAIEVNRAGHDLLLPGALPRPQNQSFNYDFRLAYNAVLTPGQDPRRYNPQLVNLPDEVLHAAYPPTAQEIMDAKAKLFKEVYAPKLFTINNVVVNQKEIEGAFINDTREFDVNFRRDKALKYKVYLEPTALPVAPLLMMTGTQASAPPDIRTMWYAQMALWVQQDISRAVARMNESAPNIPAAPVKHLVAVDIRPDPSMYVRKGVVAAAGGGDAAAAAAAGATEVPSDTRDYGLSPTGRVSNTLYDVVQFDVVAVVDAAFVNEFVQQLQFGRFLNVLRYESQVVDLDEAVDSGYDYGPRQVLEVTVRCEALYLRDWTVRHNGPMPPEVMLQLGIPAPTPDQPAAPAAPAATPAAPAS